MKKQPSPRRVASLKRLVPAVLFILTVLLSCTGCASTGPQSAPTAFDAKIWQIQTNVVQVTNTVVQTNITEQFKIIPVTNFVAGVPVEVFLTNITWQTNFIPVVQIIPATNYVYNPGATPAAISAVASTVFPGWGVVAGGALSLILGIWGSFKSRQASTSTAVAQNAQQAIAVARNVIASMPNGATLTAQFNAFLASHQADANIATEVATIIDQFVSPNEAHGAADLILKNLITPIPTAATTPTPK